jgi:hypothetical protein
LFNKRRELAVGYSRWSFLFNAIIEQNDLMELNLTGRAYTWSNDHMNPTFEKLDRFLVSPEWEEQYPLSIVTAMDRGLSDHAPVLLDTGNKTPTNIPFRFENAWMQGEDFVQIVEKSWNGPINVMGSIQIWQC